MFAASDSIHQLRYHGHVESTAIPTVHYGSDTNTTEFWRKATMITIVKPLYKSEITKRTPPPIEEKVSHPVVPVKKSELKQVPKKPDFVRVDGYKVAKMDNASWAWIIKDGINTHAMNPQVSCILDESCGKTNCRNVRCPVAVNSKKQKGLDLLSEHQLKDLTTYCDTYVPKSASVFSKAQDGLVEPPDSRRKTVAMEKSAHSVQKDNSKSKVTNRHDTHDCIDVTQKSLVTQAEVQSTQQTVRLP